MHDLYILNFPGMTAIFRVGVFHSLAVLTIKDQLGLVAISSENYKSITTCCDQFSELQISCAFAFFTL